MHDPQTPLNSFLHKLLAATGLTRRGDLVEATDAIQRALAEASGRPKAGFARAEAPTSTAAASADVLDGLVREVELEPAPGEDGDTLPGVIEPETPAPPRPGRAASRFSQSSFTAEAGTRAFKLFEPAGFEGRALPLVVMLHGCTQDPDDFAAGTRMNALAQELGLYVLYPAQAPRSNAHKCWNWFVPEDQRRGHGEPALLAGMTRHVMATHRVDADRVWVAGLSAGGAMAAILAREYPDLFAAAGVHSGLPPGAAHDVVSAFSAMKSGARGAAADDAAAVPTIVFHGDADSTVHVLNGSLLVDATLGGMPAQARREIGAANGPGRAFTRTVYHPAEGSGPSHAEHWVVHGAGHAWIGGDAAGSFTDGDGPDASREMLRFFAEHPRRSGAATT
ncbi:MAG: PHB depolymerase family esterase [Burkholderiales bacterium]|nr:PHB depolymerase family esterase [Burkholderiales bacterium]